MQGYYPSAGPSYWNYNNTNNINNHGFDMIVDIPSTSSQPLQQKTYALNHHRRSGTPERQLNISSRPSVYNRIDSAIQLDCRSILSLMRDEELYQPNYHYFTAVQEHILPYHREQAVDWIYDVAKEEKCDGDVFPLAVSIIDRFLSYQNIFKHDVQILAGVALFIASKIKATHPINASKIAYYSDQSCKIEDILSWELMVVTTLDWETESPTAFDFYDQLIARCPPISTLRLDFQETIHRMQKIHKLATLFPSMQCAIGLSYVLKNKYLTINPILANSVKSLVDSVFQLHPQLVESYFPLVQRSLTQGDYYPVPETPVPAPTKAQFSPFSTSSQYRSPLIESEIELEQMKATLPLTPINDSGFCSDVSSPESAGKRSSRFRRSSSFDEDVTPPKISRSQ